MYARLSAFVIWSLVGGSAMFWGLRLTAQPLPVPAHAIAVGDSSTAHADLTRLFGTTPVAAVAEAASTEAASRFHLLGIIAPRPRGAAAAPSHSGVALIAIDGKLPRAFAVGSQVDDGLVLQSVSLRTASIGPAQGARSVFLELPALPPPATGVLSAAGNGSTPRPVSPAVPQPVRAAVAPVIAATPAGAAAAVNAPPVMTAPGGSLPVAAPPLQTDAAIRRQ